MSDFEVSNILSNVSLNSSSSSSDLLTRFGEVWLQCKADPNCGYRTPSPAILAEHQDIHLRKENKIIECHACGFKTYKSRNIKSHNRMHDSSKITI